MPKISYSELKNWNTCSYYHKLVNIDKIKLFKGNEYTAFGNAIHDTCESMLLNENVESSKFFLEKYKEALKKLAVENYDFNKKLVLEMKEQGLDILPYIKPELDNYFNQYEVFSTEEKLFEDIDTEDYKFKGYVDLILKTPDGKYHIIDWKTCSWGWSERRKNEKMTTYQLTFYKYYFAQKHNVDLDNIKTHFALLKRTAQENKVEIFEVLSGKKKIQNALNLLNKAMYNIINKKYVKNRLSCEYCEFRKSSYCT